MNDSPSEDVEGVALYGVENVLVLEMNDLLEGEKLLKRQSNHVISIIMSVISTGSISGMTVKLNGGGQSKDLIIYST